MKIALIHKVFTIDLVHMLSTVLLLEAYMKKVKDEGRWL